MFKNFVVYFAVLLGLCVLSGCPKRNSTERSAPKITRVRWLVDKMSPLQQLELTQDTLTKSFYEDGAPRVAMQLAESIENGSNARTFIRLKKNIVWSDGTPITAAHVVAGFRAGGIPLLQKAKARDSQTIELTLDSFPLPTLPLLLSHPASAPHHPSGKVSSGPYLVVNDSLTSTRLERNPHYGFPAPGIDVIEVQKIAAANTRAELFSGQEADLVTELPLSSSLLALSKENLLITPGDELVFLAFDLQQRPFNSQGAREAVIAATQFEELRRLLPLPVIPRTRFLPGEIVLTDKRFQPDRARSLFAAARLDPFAVTDGVAPTTVAHSLSQDTLANLVAQWAQNLGAKVDTGHKGAIQILSLKEDPLSVTGGLDYFLGANPTHWRSRLFEAVLDRAGKSPDRKVWATALHEAEEILIHKAFVAVPLFQTAQAVLKHPKLAGLRQTPFKTWDFRQANWNE